MHYDTTIIMSVAEFIELPDHPKQRDTAIHAAKAKMTHLAHPAPTHMHAAAVQYDDQLYVLDGHTRRFLWATGELQPPGEVLVQVFVADAYQELLDLYDCFDAPTAHKGVADAVQSAYRLAGIEPKSTLLRGGAGIEGALRFAEGLAHGQLSAVARKTFALNATVADWSTTIMTLDKANITRLPGAQYVGAALMTVRRDGDRAVDFAKQVSEKGGQSWGATMDPVHACWSYPRSQTFRQYRNRRGGAASQMLVAVYLTCYEAFALSDDPETFDAFPTNRAKAAASFHPFRLKEETPATEVAEAEAVLA